MTTGFLLVSYGAPETKEDVVPFLEKLFSGNKVPLERINVAAEKYYEYARQSGRFSSLNEECHALLAGILRELNEHTPQSLAVPAVYWGNLFWHPVLEDTLAEMTRNGIQHALYFVTSAFDSVAGNKRYADALAAAIEKIGPNAPVLEKLPLPFDNPLFIEAQTDKLLEAMAWTALGEPVFDREATVESVVLFSAHSVPLTDASCSRYTEQLLWTCHRVAELCGNPPWELVYQSRSGEHWLGPDIRDRVGEIASEGLRCSIIVSPIGFFCENMEIGNDLDLEIGSLCEHLGLGFVRAGAVGAHPKICSMIRKMIFGHGTY